MPYFYIDTEDFEDFLLLSASTDLSYHSNRSRLLSKLGQIISRDRDSQCVEIDPISWRTIKLFLSSKNSQVTDDSRLNYETVIDELSTQLSDERGDQREEGKAKSSKEEVTKQSI